MDKLSKIREKIDEIDKKIEKLIEERIKICEEVGKIKRKYKKELLDICREKEILSKRKFRSIFISIISLCRKVQGELKIGTLGPKYSHSHYIVKKYFPNAKIILFNSIKECFSSKIKTIVVPFENSTSGTIGETLDCLYEYNCKIIGEIICKIRQHLFVHPSINSINEIKEIYTHPAAINQCSNFINNIKKINKKIKIIPVSSTSLGAKLAINRKGGVIGNILLRKLGLKVLIKDINDYENNYTRFLIIDLKGEKTSIKENTDKTSMIFCVKDRPGALHKALEVFAKNNINLKKIESRPIKNRPFEYFFFIDIEGKIDKSLLEELEKRCTYIKFLGSYCSMRL